MAAVAFRGTTYPVVLPKLKDPRLHLAATIMSLQVLGQVAFQFRLSIAQILLCLGTTAAIETALVLRRQRVLMWPASALLTGNGVAFVLRVPGTAHGDWWSVRGWWIFVAVSAGSLLSKHVLQWRGTHWFNPSNIGLVVCFLALGRARVEPLDFWWGPMSWWMGLTLAIIVAGGFAILTRLHLLRVALGFWAAFAVSVGVLALSGHAMTAQWHLGPISGFHFWWVLVTSPEVLVFLFFMITDPKTAPSGGRARVVYAVALGLLAGVLIAPTTTEFAAKVALLGSLVGVCAAMPLLRFVPRKALVLAAAPALALAGGLLVFANGPAPSFASPPALTGARPRVEILPSPGVQSQLDRPTAEAIASSLVAGTGSAAGGTVRVHLEPGTDQAPPTAVAQLAGATYRLHLGPTGAWTLAGRAAQTTLEAIRKAAAPKGLRLEDVAASVGLHFRQGSFRFGMSSENQAMMGGGVCFLDYNGDGWQDLFAVNSYASADTAEWESHGGLPRSQLFQNDHGRFRDVTAATGAGLQVQGDGCAAADLDGDGHPDLVVTTAAGVDLLWNTGHGGFAQATLPASGWYAGAAIADVNGDGRPDIFVAGYADPSEPVRNSIAGFPTNLEGVRDLLFLNEGGRRFREAGVQAGLEAAGFRHGLGAEFVDVNGDGRPDLYVANDEDPNQLYVNVPWPGGAAADPAGLGFRFEDRAVPERVADGNAGMGIAVDGAGPGLGILVTNSRHQQTAAYTRRELVFADARPLFDPALGTDFAGWGVTWADLANSGRPDLVLAAGGIPVTSLHGDAEPLRVLAPGSDGYGDAESLAPHGLVLNGRGVAAADVGNDGHIQIAVNTIGGNLVLLRPTGPSGHWLDVRLSREVPGATVAVVQPDGNTQIRSVAAGSSYLSSEDPRVHFGLGAGRVAKVVVRYPWGAMTRLAAVRADRIVTVQVPALPQPRAVASVPVAPHCTPRLGGRSVATVWDSAATAALREGTAPEPVQARDLYDLSLAMRRAEAASPRDPATAIDYAAYRVLVWNASFGSNLARSFGLLAQQLRSLCGSPGFTSTSGASAAAIGNRIGAAVIAAGRRDGSHQDLRYADPSFVSENAPLVVAQAGSTAHDATFWQPLALGAKSAQSFVGAQWGGVRTFAAKVHVGPPPFEDPSAPAYLREALAVIRATSGAAPKPGDTSPTVWNDRARAAATGTLADDVRLYLGLNGALNDAAVAAFGAKRAYDAPRPISMIRSLAFDGKLPLTPGLVESRKGVTMVRSQGRWVRGDAWRPAAATPASPGWISEASTFAYAASGVLEALTGRSFAAQAERAGTAGVAAGIETPPDEAAGRRVGQEVARRALARLG